MDKGQYGYLNNYKKKYGLFALGLLLLIVGTAIGVFLIFHTVKHVAILLPIIIALPFAKIAIMWLVVAKYRSLSKADYERIDAALSDRENCIVLYDTALSSYESISYSPCTVVDQGNIYLIWGGSNEQSYNAEKQRSYVQDIIQKTGYDFQAYSMNSVDELLESIEQAALSEDDLSVKCDRLKNRILDICV